jgi:uncharacterized protein involved in response to NO
MTRFLQIDPPVLPSRRDDSLPLFRLGFRPFYLLAALFAATSVPVWVAQYAGALPPAGLAGPIGHAHEMLFGFTLAVMVGFLFTAVRNWTDLSTPTGTALAGLALLWIAARVLVLTPYGWAAAAVNVAFPIAAAIGIGIPLVRAGNRRNYFFIAILLLLAVAAAGVHLAHLGAVSLPGWLGIRVALDAILFVLAVMAGRVVPMFTNNGVPGADASRHPAVEKAALGSLLALLAVDLVQAPMPVLVAVLAVAGVAHAARLALWHPWRTRRNPLVWVLHAAYAWLIAHLVLRALGAADVVPPPLATHALTIGAIGGLTLGMMTRTARGHTGRPLAADRWEATCYALVMLAAAIRVIGPLAVPAEYVWTVESAALLWSVAFSIFVVRYWPVLTRPRIDGRPG